MSPAGTSGIGEAPRVGFIGLGAMGRPMAVRLADAGLGLSVYDSSDVALEWMVARTGAMACADPADVGARSDVLVTMLPSAADVARVVLGDPAAAGALGGLAEGCLIVDMSSAEPAETRELGRAVSAAGRRMVDAPVSGGVTRARDGTLTIMAGGAAADVDDCTFLFEILGARTFHMGPLGSGHATKALNNAVSAAGLVAAIEALIVGQAAGVDPAVMLDVLNASTGRNNATENKIEQFVFSRSYASGFALGLMAKDVTIAADLARSLAIEPALMEAVHRLVTQADEDLGAPSDHTEIARWLEARAGTELVGRERSEGSKGVG